MAILRGSYGGEQTYTAVCDCCGEELEAEYEFHDAVTAARIAGWRAVKVAGVWQDYCPDCREKLDRENAVGDFNGIGRL